MKYILHACLLFAFAMRVDAEPSGVDISRSLVLVHVETKINARENLAHYQPGIAILSDGYFITAPLTTGEATKITIVRPNGRPYAARLCPSPGVRSCSILFCRDLQMKPAPLSPVAAAKGEPVNLCGFEVPAESMVTAGGWHSIPPIPGKIVRLNIGEKLGMTEPDFVATTALIAPEDLDNPARPG